MKCRAAFAGSFLAGLGEPDGVDPFDESPAPGVWTPFPGPQTLALESEADEMFYGGAAGGGKTGLLIGLATTRHRRSIIFRRTFPELDEVIEQLAAAAPNAKLNRNEGRMTLPGGRKIDLGYMQHEQDKTKYQGRPRDLIGIDEAPQFTKTQVEFVTTWLRSVYPGQRCRVVLTGNPPTTPEGQWIVRAFAPWLDEDHPEFPLAPGTLRWFTYAADGETLLWFKTPEPIKDPRTGELITPRSRTFIPAKLSDNPLLRDTGYRATLMSRPEPIRSQMLYGDFKVGTADDAWQVIPSAWLRAANRRWTPQPPAIIPLRYPPPLERLGVDVAYGGADATVVVQKRGDWFGKAHMVRGIDTDSGPKAAAIVMKLHEPGATVNVDAIGYGASCYDHLKPGLGNLAVPVNVGVASDQADKSGKYGFANLRAEIYWRLREALDPDGGSTLAIPPDSDLFAELTAHRYEVRSGKIALEKKSDIKERLGRSPDRADALALAHYRPKLRRLNVFA
jgi:hypothetical protein